MGQPGFGLHHFIDPRLPFSAAAAGAFRPIFGTTAAAAAAAAIAASNASSTATSSQLSDSIIGSAGSKITSSAFQPPNKGGPPTSPGSTTGSAGQTLFSPGQNLYPHRGCAGKLSILNVSFYSLFLYILKQIMLFFS